MKTTRCSTPMVAGRLAVVLLLAAALAACGEGPDDPRDARVQDPDPAAGSTSAQTSPGPPLGPADGVELPPTDTGRVAIGDTAPDFTLMDRTGEAVTLSDLRGRRIVLAFYRGHW